MRPLPMRYGRHNSPSATLGCMRLVRQEALFFVTLSCDHRGCRSVSLNGHDVCCCYRGVRGLVPPPLELHGLVLCEVSTEMTLI